MVRLDKARHFSLEMLVFDEVERESSDNLALRFEAVSHCGTRSAASARRCSTG